MKAQNLRDIIYGGKQICDPPGMTFHDPDTIRVLGCDQSIASTGIAVLDAHLTDAGRVEIEVVLSGLLPTQTRDAAGRKAENISRALIMADDTEQLCLLTNPAAFVMEQYAYAASQANYAASLGEVGACIKLAWHRHTGSDHFPRCLSPGQIKKFSSGNGACKKDLVIKEVFRKWKFDTDDDNVADAFALAVTWAYRYFWTPSMVLYGYEAEVMATMDPWEPFGAWDPDKIGVTY